MSLTDAAKEVVGQTPGTSSITIENAATIAPQLTNWMWHRHIPFGQLTDLNGDPGMGKSTIALDLAARASRGADWPDGTSNHLGPKRVIVASIEDDPHQTLVPRLIAAGAVMANIDFITGSKDADGNETGTPEFPRHIDELDRILAETNAKFVIFDPALNYLNTGTDSHAEMDVKKALAPLTALLRKHQAAGLVVRHQTKDKGKAAIMLGGGAVGGFAGVVRSGFLVAASPTDPDLLLLCQYKNSLAKKQLSVSYRIADALARDNGFDFPTSVIDWHETVETTAEEATASHGRPGPESYARNEATEFLRERLKNGPVPTNDLTAEAEAAGISERTLKRARGELGVWAQKVGNHWESALPADMKLGRETPNAFWTVQDADPAKLS